jgi:hypothetical protein
VARWLVKRKGFGSWCASLNKLLRQADGRRFWVADEDLMRMVSIYMSKAKVVMVAGHQIERGGDVGSACSR